MSALLTAGGGLSASDLAGGTLPASVTTLTTSGLSTLARLTASTTGNQHTLTSTSSTIDFDKANVLAIRHTLANGSSAIALLRHSDGFEMGAVGYKSVGAGNTYLDGAVYIAAGVYSSVDGSSASATPPPIIFGQEWGGTTQARVKIDVDWQIKFYKKGSAVLHTTVGAEGGWLIGSSSTTATNQILDAIGKTCLGDWTDVTDRNTQSSGWGVTILNTSTNANLLRMVKNNVGKMDIQYNGTSGTRRIDFLDTDNSVTTLSLSMAGTGAVTFAGPVSGITSLTRKISTQTVGVGGAIFDDFTSTSTTSTNGTEDDLFTHTTVASTLGTNGDCIEQVEHVSFVSSATAARRLKKYFAGSLIFDSTALTLTLGGEFDLFTTVIRESSTVVRCAVSVTSTSASSIPYSTYTRITGLTLSGTNILKTTGIASGTGAASADIADTLSKIFWFPASS